jgi:hypothetical protein
MADDLGVGPSMTTSAFIGSNLPTRRHYFRFARDPGTIFHAIVGEEKMWFALLTEWAVREKRR